MSPTVKKKQKQDLTFDQALEELEQITTKLEQQDVKFDDIEKMYERALFLRNFCKQKLDSLKFSIEEITQDEK